MKLDLQTPKNYQEMNSDIFYVRPKGTEQEPWDFILLYTCHY